jgi:hypothetical protein
MSFFLNALFLGMGAGMGKERWEVGVSGVKHFNYY